VDRRKAIVRDAYDAVADAWGRARRAPQADARERAWLERFFAALPNDASVLDLGCGSGAPMLVEVIERGYRAMGVDFSRQQLLQARSRCPRAALLQADIAEVEFESASFDGVIAYDSIWHVPRQEHSPIFERIREWLVVGGAALFTLAAAKGEGELFTELIGVPVFYDSRPEAASLQMLGAAGFSIVGHDLKPVSGARPAEGHLIVLAKAI
jgi:cyclopropane fatty-acyl-phospholipid synthase-like methyltransferase